MARVAKVKAKSGLVTLLCGLLAAVMGLVGVAGAQTTADKSKIDQQIDATKKQVDTATAEEQRLLGLIEASSNRKAALDAKVAGFDGQIAAVQRQLDSAQSKLNALEAQQRATEVRLGESRQALQAAKDELGRQAIAAYTGQSEAASYASMLLKSSSLSDLASKRSYMRAVVGSQTDAIAATEHLRDEVADLGKELDASRCRGPSDARHRRPATGHPPGQPRPAGRSAGRGPGGDRPDRQAPRRGPGPEGRVRGAARGSRGGVGGDRSPAAPAPAGGRGGGAGGGHQHHGGERVGWRRRGHGAGGARQGPGPAAHARARRAGDLPVRLPHPPDLRHLPPAHRHRLRRQRGRGHPGVGRRGGRERQLVRRLRQRDHHRPRRWRRHAGGPPVGHVGLGQPEGHPGPDHRPGRLHGRLHRPSRPLRGARERRPCEPGRTTLSADPFVSCRPAASYTRRTCRGDPPRSPNGGHGVVAIRMAEGRTRGMSAEVPNWTGALLPTYQVPVDGR